MISFGQYLIEQKKAYKRGIVSHLDIMSHWANELHKIHNPSHTTQSHTPSALKWFSRTSKPFTVTHPSHGWIVQTDNPSSKTSKADIMVHAPEGHRSFGIEAKSGRPSLTSSTLSNTFEINPESPVASRIHDVVMSGKIKGTHKLVRGLEWLKKTKPEGTEGFRRSTKIFKQESDTHHPLISEYENALHGQGIKAISITDDKGNIRHFSTNPEHQERLSKYVNAAHIQHKGGRLSLRISEVGVGEQKRKETRAIPFLSKQPVGLSVQEIVNLNKA
jgi:hypothetical protein